MKTMEKTEKYTVLSPKLGGGPHGLGDPDDKSLRHVEKDVLIPKKMRERAHKEKCVPEVAAFSKCAKESGLSMVYKCREENRQMFSCLERWFRDEKFIEECTNEYLEERSIYRRTGVGVRDQIKMKITPDSTQ